jgi:hypothetical protein
MHLWLKSLRWLIPPSSHATLETHMKRGAALRCVTKRLGRERKEVAGDQAGKQVAHARKCYLKQPLKQPGT